LCSRFSDACFPHPLQDWHFICKIRKKSGMDTPSVTHGNHVNPLEDLIIHLCIKDALTCRTVIEVGLAVRNLMGGGGLAVRNLIRTIDDDFTGIDIRQSAHQRTALQALSEKRPSVERF
jgi:hypothetical protein